MICPHCKLPVSERDVVWLLGVAGHFECHRRNNAANARVTLTAFFTFLLLMGGGIAAFVWFVVLKK